MSCDGESLCPEKIHSVIREEIRADSIIPLKGNLKEENREKIQKQLNMAFDNARYKSKEYS